MSSTVTVSGWAAGAASSPGVHDRRPRDDLRAARARSAPAAVNASWPGVQPSSTSCCSTSGRPGRLEVGEHPARRLLADLELLPCRDQLLQVGSRPLERHGGRTLPTSLSRGLVRSRIALAMPAGQAAGATADGLAAVDRLARDPAGGSPRERRVPPRRRVQHQPSDRPPTEHDPARAVDAEDTAARRPRQADDHDQVDDAVGPPGEHRGRRRAGRRPAPR